MPHIGPLFSLAVSGCHYLWSKRWFLFTLLAIPNALRMMLVFFPEMNRSIQIEDIFYTEIDDVVVFFIGVVLAIECILSIVSFCQLYVCHPMDAQFARAHHILPTILSLASVAHAVWLNILVWKVWTEHFFTGVVYLQALPTVLLMIHSFIQGVFVSCMNVARRPGGIQDVQQSHEISRHIEAHGWFNVLLLLYTISMVIVAVKSDYKMSTPQQLLIGLAVTGDIINRSFSARFLLGLKVQAVEVQAVEVQAVEVQAVEVQAVEVQAVEVQAVEVQDQNSEREQPHFPFFFQYNPPLFPSDRHGNCLPFLVLCDPSSYNNPDITSNQVDQVENETSEDERETGHFDSAAMVPEEESELGRFDSAAMVPGEGSELRRFDSAAMVPEEESELGRFDSAAMVPEEESELRRFDSAAMVPEEESELRRFDSAAMVLRQRAIPIPTQS